MFLVTMVQCESEEDQNASKQVKDLCHLSNLFFPSKRERGGKKEEETLRRVGGRDIV